MATSSPCVWRCRSTGHCSACFNSLYELMSHMRNVHSSSNVVCEVDGCCESFKSPSVWYWHVRRSHASSYFQYSQKRTRDEEEETLDDNVDGSLYVVICSN